MIAAICNTALLAVVAICGLLHVNRSMSRHTAGCERFGFVLLVAGAIGLALKPWWPWGGLHGVQTIFYLGLALVAISLVRGELRALFSRAAEASRAKEHKHFFNRFEDTK